MSQRLMRLAGWLPTPVRRAIVESPLGPWVRRAMRALAPGDTAVVPLSGPLAGYRMRLDLRWQRGMAYGDYESAVTATLLDIVQPGWLVADIGAQNGYMTLLLARAVGPRGQALAFEPMPANYAALQENIALNNLRHVRAERLAVSDRNGPVSLRRLDNRPLSATASLVADDAGLGAVQVEGIRLDDYLAGRVAPLRFVKMDIEGAEALALAGMRDLIARDHPIFLIEIHDLGAAGNPAPTWLADQGYALFAIEADGRRHPASVATIGHLLAVPAP